MTLLHLELPGSTNRDGVMIFKMKGKPQDISKLIATAMDSSPEVMAFFIIAVLSNAVKNKIPFADLETIYNNYKS